MLLLTLDLVLGRSGDEINGCAHAQTPIGSWDIGNRVSDNVFHLL